MTRTAVLVLAALLDTGCGKTFCEAQGYLLVIEDPPWSVAHYGFLVEFENISVELDCEVLDDGPAICETYSGPWRVAVELDIPGSAYFSGIAVFIENGDEFTGHVPEGEIRIVVTDVDDPLFEVEFISDPEAHGFREGRRVCEWAQDVWRF